MEITLTPFNLVIIFCMMAVGAALQGSIGYGMALIASPVIIQIDPALVPGPFIVAAFLLIILMVIRERQALDISAVRWGIAGMVPGTLLGSWILSSLETESMVIVFALLVLVAVGLSVIGIRLKPARETLLVAGLLSGVMGVLTALSGPPMALLYQGSPGERLRANLSGYFIVASLVAIASMISVGVLGPHEVRLSLVLIPGVLTGFLISSHIVLLVDRGYTRAIILVLSFLAALSILVRSFLLYG